MLLILVIKYFVEEDGKSWDGDLNRIKKDRQRKYKEERDGWKKKESKKKKKKKLKRRKKNF